MIPTYELELEQEGRHGTFVISVVDEPAHEETHVAFNKEEKLKLSSHNEDKRIITGAVLVPDVQIYRGSPEPHYVTMSKETIEKTVEQFSKLSDSKAVSIDHNGKDISGFTIVEQWIVLDKDNDKSNSLGLDLPEGTWVVSMKVDNDEAWDTIKNTDMLNGFSIEGFYKRELIEDETLMEKDEKSLLTKLAELLNFYSPKEEVVEEVKEEEVVEETKPEEEEVVEEIKEEVKPEEEVTFSKEEVDVMIAEALAKKDEELALAKEKDEELVLAKEEEVETIMSRSAEGSDKMKETIEYFNKLKNK